MKQIIYVIFVVCMILSCKKKDRVLEVLEKLPDKTNITKDATLEYNIVEEQDISLGNRSRRVVRVVVQTDTIPSPDDLESTFTIMWKSSYSQYDEVTVFAYLPEMDTRDVAYSVIEYNASGLDDFKINDYALWGTKWRDSEKTRIEATDKWDNEKANPRVKDYFINISYKKASGKYYDIDVLTNFPDGTNLMLGVSRTYRLVGETEEYAGDIFSQDLKVLKGQITAKVNIDDSIWIREYQSRKSQFSSIMDFPSIGQVSGKVNVSVLFSPRRAQQQNVIKILGENGEYVKGTGAEKTGNFTTFSEEVSISIPFKPQ